MKIYVIRHGQVDFNKQGLRPGKLDLPLNDEGIRQVEYIVSRLPDDVKIIYSSPLIRARQTAEIINKRFNLEIKHRSGLEERDMGSFSGTPWPSKEAKALDYEQKYDYRPQGGESVADVQARLVKVIDEIKTAETGPVLIVAHGGIIRLMYYLYSESKPVHFVNASISEFDI